MSDQSGGPGWWMASDGKWYPPEQHANYRPTQFMPPPPPPPPPPPLGPQAGGDGVEAEAATRPWYKKKRFMIPIGLFVLLIIVSATSGDPEKVAIDVASRDTTTTAAEEVEATTTEATAPTTAPPTTAPPTTATPTTADPFAGETVSQNNARQKAAEYLDYSSFSRSGLIEQLKFEGFTQAQAEHGADSVGL